MLKLFSLGDGYSGQVIMPIKSNDPVYVDEHLNIYLTNHDGANILNDYKGRPEWIGNTHIIYGYNGKPEWIDNTHIIYGYNGNVEWVGDKRIY